LFLGWVEAFEGVVLGFEEGGVYLDGGGPFADGGLAHPVGWWFDEVDLVVVVVMGGWWLGEVVGCGGGVIGDGVSFGVGVLVLENGLVEVDVRHLIIIVWLLVE